MMKQMMVIRHEVKECASLAIQAIEEQLSVAELEKSLEAAGIPKVKKAKVLFAKEGALWNPPLTSEGNRISFKASSFDVSLLTEERKTILKSELEKVLLLLS